MHATRTPGWARLLGFLGLGLLVSLPAYAAPDGWPGFEKDAPQAKGQRKKVRDRGETVGAQKFAFLVGIGHYGRQYTPNLAEGARSWGRLYGPETDVKMLTQELHRRGFEVATLLNEDATRDGIIRGFLEHLYDKVVPGRGDTALFFFAGHGQQVSDLNGDESDGYDEALVAFDNGGVQSREGRLLDDDLGKMIRLLGKRTDNIVVVSDSCHSGTLSRGVLRARGGEPPVGDPGCAKAKCAADPGQGEFDDQTQYVLLTAAGAHQVALEKDLPASGQAEASGLLTYNLVAALRALPPGATYEALFARLKASMHGVSGRQDPTLEGDRQKVIFGSTRGEKAAGFHVQKNAGGYIVHGGLASGLAKGTLLGVFPFSKADATQAKAAPLKLEIREVGVTGAKATVVGGVPVDPALDTALTEEGGAGFILSHRYGGRALRVDVSQAPASYRTDLLDVSGVRLVEDPKAFDFAVRSETREVEGKPVAVLTLVNAAGKPMPLPGCANTPPLSAVRADAKRGWHAIANALEFEERRQRLLAFAGDGGAADVQGRLKVLPLDGTAQAGAGATRLTAKGKYRFEVTNLGKTPLYPYIVELATDGTIGVLYPQPGRDAEPVAHGTPWIWPKSHVTAGTVAGTQQFALLASKAPLSDIRTLELKLRPYSCSGTRGSTPPPPDEASPWHLSFADAVIEDQSTPSTRSRGTGQRQQFFYYSDQRNEAYRVAPNRPSPPPFAPQGGRTGHAIDFRAEEPYMWTITKSTGIGVLLGALLGGGVMLAAEAYDNWQILSIGALSGMGIGMGVGIWEVTRRHQTPPPPAVSPFARGQRGLWVPLFRGTF